MNNTQNDKIAQVTDDTIVIGIDIGSLVAVEAEAEPRP